MRRAFSEAGPLARAKRSLYLFSRPTRRACRGSGYVMHNRTRLTRGGTRERGICTNRLTIRREEVETRVLRAMQERLGHAEALPLLAAPRERSNQLRLEEHAAAAAGAQELARVQPEITRLVRLLIKERLDSSIRRRGSSAGHPASSMRAPRPTWEDWMPGKFGNC